MAYQGNDKTENSFNCEEIDYDEDSKSDMTDNPISPIMGASKDSTQRKAIFKSERFSRKNTQITNDKYAHH